MNTAPVRVRFAPSPTGYLHIGGVRTALFNWLFARKTGGVFILRIEDTDEKRSTIESLHAILDGLAWLGLNWDEGPYFNPQGDIVEKGNYGSYFQMERLQKYNQWIERLQQAGRIYKCWCTKDELTEMRADALAKKTSLKYGGHCRRLTEAEKNKLQSSNTPYVWRFKVEEGDDASFTDVIHGDKTIPSEQLEDFVIIKSTGGPTYNFACVIDDHEMGITHVIRGDDHLSNTPRQVLLYRACGFPVPQFAHLPMILGSDGSRLSKRHGSTALEEYKQEGFLTEALLNYLALLGWSTSDSQQIFGRDELIHKFSLERCSKSPAIFDPQKLEWMNGEYIRSMTPAALMQQVLPLLKEKKLCDEHTDLSFLEKIMKLVQEKFKRLDEVPQLVNYFFTDYPEYDKEAVREWLTSPVSLKLLSDLKSIFESLADFSPQAVESAVRTYAKQNALKTPAVFHPLRVAVSGRTQGPSLFELLSLLGKDRVIRRLLETPAITGRLS